ncbi:hypothetical protein D3C75_1144910 [compost metagenome]
MFDRNIIAELLVQLVFLLSAQIVIFGAGIPVQTGNILVSRLNRIFGPDLPGILASHAPLDISPGRFLVLTLCRNNEA